MFGGGPGGYRRGEKEGGAAQSNSCTKAHSNSVPERILGNLQKTLDLRKNNLYYIGAEGVNLPRAKLEIRTVSFGNNYVQLLNLILVSTRY